MRVVIESSADTPYCNTLTNDSTRTSILDTASFSILPIKNTEIRASIKNKEPYVSIFLGSFTLLKTKRPTPKIIAEREPVTIKRAKATIQNKYLSSRGKIIQ